MTLSTVFDAVVVILDVVILDVVILAVVVHVLLSGKLDSRERLEITPKKISDLPKNNNSLGHKNYRIF